MSLDSYVGQILIYTISGVAVAAIGVLGTHEFKRRGASQRLEQKMDRITVALVGDEASDLQPNPAPGLIARVDEYQKANVQRKELGDALMLQFAEHKRVVTALVAKVDTIQVDIKALVADGRTNGGSSSRDAINRIENAVTKKPLATTPEVREIVDEHEAHVDAKQDELLEAINKSKEA